MKIIWCTVPEIWSTRDINFCQFGHFFCSFTPLLTEKIKILKKLKNTGDIIILHVYHKWQSYDVWYLRYGMRRTNFFDSWGGILCSFTSLATRKIKILKKWKKKNAWRYHPFTQVYQKSRSYLCYSWDMACDGCNFFIFHFGLFFTLTGWKIKVLKKWKKRLEISSFYTCVPKTMITWCMVPEIWCETNGRK